MDEQAHLAANIMYLVEIKVTNLGVQKQVFVLLSGRQDAALIIFPNQQMLFFLFRLEGSLVSSSARLLEARRCFPFGGSEALPESPAMSEMSGSLSGPLETG